MNPYLPVGPLVAAVVARGGLHALLPEHGERGRLTCRQVASYRRNYQRRRRSGTVTVGWADRFCIDVLGELPELVYGEQWWATVVDDAEVAA